MYPVSDLYLQVIRNWRAVTCTATHYDPFTKTSTPIPIVDGAVTVDSTAACRRVLSLTITPTQALWDALAAPGGEITVTQTTRYIDHSTETIPLGVFVVDQDTLSYAAAGQLTMTCRDRWVIVQRNRYRAADSTRSSVPSNMTWQEIKRQVEGAWPNAAYPFPGWAQMDTSATTKVGPLLWADGDRESAITTMADAASLQVFFDPNGKAVLRLAPVLTSSSKPVWTVDAGAQGVMIAADRARDRTRTRNAVIVTTTAAGLYLPPVTVANANTADPLSTVGPLGFVPFYLSSPTFYTTAQMRAAGVTKLSRQLGVAEQIQLENSPNGALDADDVIGVLVPQIDANTTPTTEVKIIDTLTVPLLPTGTQQIQTRSTRPTADDSGGS